MQRILSKALERITGFLRLNPVLTILFFFLLIAGVAAGAQSITASYAASSHLDLIPMRLHMDGIPFLTCAVISICVNGLAAGMLLLSGVWLPATILWPIAVIFRGIITGTALGLIVQALPGAVSFCLIGFLLVETAVMLPAFISIAALSKDCIRSILSGIAHSGKNTKIQENPAPLYIGYLFRLLPCVALECIFAPLALYLFC